MVLLVYLASKGCSQGIRIGDCRIDDRRGDRVSQGAGLRYGHLILRRFQKCSSDRQAIQAVAGVNCFRGAASCHVGIALPGIA